MFDASTPQSNENIESPENQLQHASCSIEVVWEDWMDWNPSNNSVPGQQPISFFKTNAEDLNVHGAPTSQMRSPIRRSSPTRKRKALQDVEDEVHQAQGRNGKITEVEIRSHSMVEKRYRTNLNDKIALLSQSVPSLRDPSLNPSECHNSGMPVKHNKATVLTKAIEYIQHLERRNAYLEDANSALRSRPLAAAKVVHREEIDLEEEKHKLCSSISDSSHIPKQKSATTVEEPRGMIPVPEDMKRLRESVPPQSHYADQPPFQEIEQGSESGSLSTRGRGLISRLTIGSLAGLTIIDGLVGDHEEGNHDRGLFALPMPTLLPLLRSFWSMVGARLRTVPYNHIVVPLFRGVLIFSVLGIALFLYLFNSKPKLRRVNNVSNKGNIRFSGSPVEMRRKAWLTAIQTVWVPRHTMLPELLALILETHAYMTRRLLGWHSYSWLTGRNEEDEIARVRAWEIAIDAQLTGGDVEMSKSRLVLTLWASGTMPNTPARLMLKALHIRILFWQASRAFWLSEAFNCAARYLARQQWRSGEDLINNPIVSKDPSGSDPLPDHLVALLQQPIDEIMTDSAISSAYNLAWNETLFGSSEERGTNTEDTAMLGSLDSLAAWSCNSKLQRALIAFVEATGTYESHQSQIELALRVAPPGSISSLKALAATTVMCETGRRQSITLLLTALRPSNAFCLQEPSITPLPPSAICESISVAVDCASAIEALAHSEDQINSLYSALRCSSCILSKVESLDLISFAAIYRLMFVISEHTTLVGELALKYNEHVLNAITQLGQPIASARMENSRQQEVYIGALKKLALRTSLERRVSSISIDTGYGSMSDHDI